MNSNSMSKSQLPGDPTLDSLLAFINSECKSSPIILHSDIGVVARKLRLTHMSRTQICEHIVTRLQECTSSSSIFIPTFDYSYCQTRTYDVRQSISQLGGLSKYCSKQYPQYRTLVPVFSHVDIKYSHDQVNHLYSTNIAFGRDSFYDWFTSSNGFIFFWGCSLSTSNTFIHHLEASADVSYRHNKEFPGTVRFSDTSKEANLIYLVRPRDVEIDYVDQGRSLLQSSNLLISNHSNNLEGFSSVKFLEQGLAALADDEYSLLTNDTRRSISIFLANPAFLRKFTESKKDVLLLSDMTLDFLTRGWKLDRYNVETRYASSPIIDLEAIVSAESSFQDILVLMPSLDAFSLGLLDCYDNEGDIYSGISSIISHFISLIKRFSVRHPSSHCIFISPFDYSFIPYFSKSVESQCKLTEKFSEYDSLLFNAITDCGFHYERAPDSRLFSVQTKPSIRNFLRYRFPYEASSIPALRLCLSTALEKSALTRSPIKAISVDLDNTLWAGIAGDGEAFVSRDYPANCSLMLQKILKQLHSAGLFLVITSKNDIDTVHEAFEKLRESMLVSIDDFACIQANWGRKSNSLKQAARHLNIGLDSFLHIDDSDFEINEVMTALPMVEVIRFSPENIDLIVNSLLNHPRLHRSKINYADKNRSLNFNRAYPSLSNQDPLGLSDNSFLAELHISLNVLPSVSAQFDAPRVRQLFDKTNQFNTTQLSYNQMSGDVDNLLFCLVYKDRFCLPEVCSAIGVQMDSLSSTATVTGFVLSCRFFSRGIEYYFLVRLLELLGANAICVNFTMSKRNLPCFQFLKNISSEALPETISIGESATINISHDNLARHADNYRQYYVSS